MGPSLYSNLKYIRSGIVFSALLLGACSNTSQYENTAPAEEFKPLATEVLSTPAPKIITIQPTEILARSLNNDSLPTATLSSDKTDNSDSKEKETYESPTQPEHLAGEVDVIGYSVEGRELNVWKIGSGEQKVFFMGGLHTGREADTADLADKIALYFRRHLEEIPSSITMLILTNANPDGYANGSHNNAHGVDLNRNWDEEDWRYDACHSGIKTSGGIAPLSEPETAAIDDFLMEHKPIVSFSWHARVPMVEDNDMDIADQVAAVYAESSGYPHVNRYVDYPCREIYGRGYELTGQWLDYMTEKGMAAIDIELSDYYIAEFDRNLVGILAVLDFIDQNVVEIPNVQK